MTTTVIKRPILTEKANKVQESRKYTFEVTPDANKIQIKHAIKALFGVEVDNVRTVVIRGKNKTRMTKRGLMRGHTPLRKKAIITLKSGYTIDIVGGEGNVEE
ncbi:MAG: 50S ribosomal protein L23 [Candidatus Kapaibacterium sp.]|jgi:large subunit ribosomal protein L23|nr:50S ribosomal protein L23 [Candidatus Kapabacteria bacterium]